VALGLAIHLLNQSAANEVSSAARSLFGLADLAVESGIEDFDENIYPRIARLPGVAVASPVLAIEAKLVTRRGVVTLFGTDVFRSQQLQPALAGTGATMSSEGLAMLDTDTVFLSASAARDLALQEGDQLQVLQGTTQIPFKVAGVLPASVLRDYAGIVDIAAAQWRFGKLGRLTRINLRLSSGADPQKVRASLRALLPVDARIITPGEAGDDAVRLSRSYRSNLTALALVALFTGGFFVYSTQSLASLRRRREFALLHALGVTRAAQAKLMLLNGALLGLTGSLLGVVVGLVLAQAGLRAIGGDLGAGYFRGVVPTVELSITDIVMFCALGTAIALMGSARPALDTARTPTALALKAGDVSSHSVQTHTPLVLLLFGLAAVALLLPPIASLPLPGYFAIALLVLAAVISMPWVMRVLLKHAPRANAVSYEVALAQLRGTARYATLSVSAIVVSFSLMVSMAIMVTSFRASLDHWTQRILPADLYVRVGYTGQTAFLDPPTLEKIRAIRGLQKVEATRLTDVSLSAQGAPLTLVARDIDPARAQSVLWMVASAPDSANAKQPAVWVTEAAADLFALKLGQSIDMNVGGHSLTARVAGIWRDYEHQRGAIAIDRRVYQRLTGDASVNSVWMWAQPDASLDEIRNAVRDYLPPGGEFDLRTPGEIRRLSLLVFDRTFAITYVLEAIAIIIGLFGISAGTSAQVLARRGEFGVLRHLGFTRRQVATILAIEGALLGAIGVIAGLVTGAMVSLILIYVVNRQSFHWSMDLYMPTGPLALLSCVLIALSALIAMLAGRQAMTGDVVRAVKEDW
jgi:putative ABC transport system permease protein